MQTIRLHLGEWAFDPSVQLGPKGGFGTVFKGTGPDGPVAVKQLDLTASQAAHREMSVGEILAGRQLQNVVPILDYGQDANSDRYYLVMPVCSYSLQDQLKDGPIDFAAGRAILLDIISGLLEVRDIVHRDLKPGNILIHGGRWKIADFGIAKFVEDSTSLLTLREALTPSYAAPEQWNGDRPTGATDVYALACIAYAVFGGGPPFTGDLVAIRQGHLHQPPPPLAIPPSVAAVFMQALRKAPEGRPALSRIQDVLKRSEASTARPVSTRLALAAQTVASEKAKTEAAERELKVAEERYRSLLLDALSDFKRIKSDLFRDIGEASLDVVAGEHQLRWGQAKLSIPDPKSARPYRREISKPQPDQVWEIVMAAEAKLVCNESNRNAYTYGSSIFFGRNAASDPYRWYEASFWNFSGTHNLPASLDMFSTDAMFALSRTMHVWSVALGPLAIDGEDEVSFHDRWQSLVAKAASGTLQRPNQMPPLPSFYE